MNNAEWDLISQMCAFDPSKRVDITYVVNRLKQFTLDNMSVSEAVQASSSDTEQVPFQSVDEHEFAALGGATIPSTLQTIRSRCEKLSDNRWMASNVCPALEFVFDLLQARHKTPEDAEVVKFCSVLSQFQRYLRTTWSPKSLNQLVRSRKVAEAHYVVYAELDCLLGMLEVPNDDPIRMWRGLDSDVLGGDQDSTTPEQTTTAVSNLGPAKKTSGAVTLTHFSSPSSSKHEFWTQTGLAAWSTHPSWYLPLRKLVFSESDEIGRGSFGTVYRGTWQGTPVVVKFMGYEEDLETISTDLLLHEVRVWHRLNHPHVLKLYGACHVDKRYFVCEVASSGNLFKFLKKSGNEKFAWLKLHEVALGLLYLHGENVVHNDLWRDNIMVGMDSKAKLIDFGLSCLLHEVEIQVDVKRIGAVNYRSPEYLASERPSFASDVYSFAMCIIEVINGDVPWGSNAISAAQIRFQQRKGNTPQFTAPITEKQQNLIRLMTLFDPVKRVRMALVVDILKEIAQEEAPIEAP